MTVRRTALELKLEDLPDVLDVTAAAAAVHVNRETLMRHIKSGALAAFTPMGKTNRSPGRGMGYRIHRRDLQRWYFGPQGDEEPPT